jgi:hypothetical protein
VGFDGNTLMEPERLDLKGLLRESPWNRRQDFPPAADVPGCCSESRDPAMGNKKRCVF